MMETRKHHGLSFAEGMEVLLQAEEDDRSGKRFKRLQKKTHFRYQALVQELHMDASMRLDKSQISNLATGEYITKGESYDT